MQNSAAGGAKRFGSAIRAIQLWLAMTCFVLMSLFVIAGVVMRFLLQIPFSWGEEISRYLMVAAVTLGIGIGVREKAHLGVTMIVEAAPAMAGYLMKLFALGVSLFGYLFLTSVSYDFMAANYRFGQTSPALGVPMYLLYAVLMAGFFLSAMECALLLLEFIRTGRETSGDTDGQPLY